MTRTKSLDFFWARSPLPALHDSVRTRHMARMDSFNYPDAVICSDGDADGSAAISKLTEALYDNAMEDVSDPRTSSRTSRKVGKSGKKNGTPTKVSKRSLRSGVMNRNNASCDDSPLRRRRPSFNTATSADRSPLDTPGVTEDDHLEDDAGAAPTTRSCSEGPQPSPPAGACDARHPLHDPAAAEGGATLSHIWTELRLAQPKG